MVKQGFFAKKGTKYIKFPKRDWFTTTTFNSKTKLTAYLEKSIKDKTRKHFIQKGTTHLGKYLKKLR